MTIQQAIQQAYGLSEAHAAIVQELTSYHAERFAIYQRAQNDRARIPHLHDGRYSVNRLLLAAADHNVHRDAPHEFEVSQRIAEELGREPHPGHYFVPVDRQRTLTVAAAGAGGYLVGTEVAPGDVFTGTLLATLGTKRLGMPVIPMVDNAVFPRMSATVTAGWLTTEGATINSSNHTLGTSAGAPHNIAAYIAVSDRLLRQTSAAAQNFLLGETARAVSAAADSAIVQGSGASGQPLGILNAAGIGSVAGAALAYGGVLDTVATVENANGVVNPGSLGWAMPSATARILRARERSAGSGFIIEGNTMAGAPVDVTNAMPANTALYGDWSGVALLEWGVLELGADPYGVNSALFAAAQVGIRAIWTCDVVVLRPASFCKVTSIT